VIIANVAALLLESIPSVDKAVGDDPGNLFDVFEPSLYLFLQQNIYLGSSVPPRIVKRFIRLWSTHRRFDGKMGASFLMSIIG
jgi:hypothetical protein